MFRSEDGRRSTALANASKSRRFSGTANASKVERVSGIHPPHPPAYTQERAGRLPPSCQARALTAERPGAVWPGRWGVRGRVDGYGAVSDELAVEKTLVIVVPRVVM